jgi:signal peptidase I
MSVLNSPHSRHKAFITIPQRAVSIKLIVLFLLVGYSGLAAYSGLLVPLRLVVGSSMEPTLEAGDLVLLKSLPFSSIRVGDLLAYRWPDAAIADASGAPQLVLHRVVAEDTRGAQRVLYTKGDNSLPDPWSVTSGDVEGAMSLRIPFAGKPLLLVKGRGGMAVLLVGTVAAAALVVVTRQPLAGVARRRFAREYQQSRDDATSGVRNGAYPVNGLATSNESGRKSDIAHGADSLAWAVTSDTVLSGVSALWMHADSGRGADVTSTAYPYLGVNARWLALRRENAAASNVVVAEFEAEQRVENESLQRLRDSISQYAAHLREHTGALDNLATLTRAYQRVVVDRGLILPNGSTSASEQEKVRTIG